MPITSMQELFRTAYDHCVPFSERLGAIKAAHPEIAWYPFQTFAKMTLLGNVTDYLDAREPIRLSGEKPRVLDVGTADGDLAFLFESAGCDVMAIDNHHSNNNRCAGIQTMKGLLGSRIGFQDVDIDYDLSLDESYDFVIFLDILYHLRNPLGALINLSRAARYMALSTRICERMPTGESLANVPCAYLLAPFEAAANDPTNYWMFTEAGLSRTLERGGWRVLKRAFFGYPGNDSSPSDPAKDKRIICLCERVEGFERLKYGHVPG